MIEAEKITTKLYTFIDSLYLKMKPSVPFTIMIWNKIDIGYLSIALKTVKHYTIAK